MTRYISLAKLPKPHGEWFEDESLKLPAMSVICEDDTPQDTGLLDANGDKIYRVHNRKWGF